MFNSGSQQPARTRRRSGPLVAAGVEEAGEELSRFARQEGFDLVFVDLDSEGRPQVTGDPDSVAQVELLWCHGRFKSSWVRASVDNLPSLSWIHSDFVGMNGVPVKDFSARGIIITNGAGNFARAMAEWVVLGVLSSAKEYARFIRCSDKGVWDNSHELRELAGARVLLLGLGSLNTLVARMLAPFEMTVVGWTRSPRLTPTFGVTSSVTGDSWKAELAQADYLVVGLPLTRDTRHLLGRDEFAKMKPDATLINLSRGAIIDESALEDALKIGRLRYCLLDAFETEPLPVESSLWARENVTVLPHHSWSSRSATANTVHLMESQVARWMAGTELMDPVDVEAGY